MDALLTAFLAALLAAWGDQVQLTVAALSARSGRPGQVLAGAALAAFAGNAVAAFAGAWIATLITIRAMSLLVALALIYSGAAGLARRAPPTGEGPLRLLVLAAFFFCGVAELGDRTQFLTFALAGRFHAAPYALAGATAGTLAAAIPAAVLGARFHTTLPIRAMRYAVAALFLLTGFILAVNALQLT
jgi:putative Ca2+/H+ antiporter (TMEM165/GDT1 family)